jgi:lipopolysaccharide biosynthesis glycosyltransferase
MGEIYKIDFLKRSHKIIISMIHIACSADNNYAPYAGVLMTSVGENVKSNRVCFHVMTDGFSNENLIKLKRIAIRYEIELDIQVVEMKLLSSLPLTKGMHFNAMVWCRIVLPTLFPNLDKVIYLDSDLCVLEDLKDLWNTNIDNIALAAVPDMFCHNILTYNRLDYDISAGYFNSGVLLLNLDYWRKHSIQNQVLNYASTTTCELKYPDQDVLNYVLRDQKRFLPMKFNVQEGYFFKKPYIARSMWSELHDAISHPSIMHYTGGGLLKPWVKGSAVPGKIFFEKYAALSGWGDGLYKPMPLKEKIFKYMRCKVLKRAERSTRYIDGWESMYAL